MRPPVSADENEDLASSGDSGTTDSYSDFSDETAALDQRKTRTVGLREPGAFGQVESGAVVSREKTGSLVLAPTAFEGSVACDYSDSEDESTLIDWTPFFEFANVYAELIQDETDHLPFQPTLIYLQPAEQAKVTQETSPI